MPVGNPTYFEGQKDINEIFGFVKVKVKAPESLKSPILPYKIKRNGA